MAPISHLGTEMPAFLVWVVRVRHMLHPDRHPPQSSIFFRAAHSISPSAGSASAAEFAPIKVSVNSHTQDYFNLLYKGTCARHVTNTCYVSGTAATFLSPSTRPVCSLSASAFPPSANNNSSSWQTKRASAQAVKAGQTGPGERGAAEEAQTHCKAQL
ncbi:unnamed protein product [Pleuronectes platessa]|uniref:Uncharacterized protein n=1 Tax=Pleuronectes platessa TaxID=8262 RepID=A0A9N7TR12_PLEPL|nr:unnamed protein product [Pleuronectes platessa]